MDTFSRIIIGTCGNCGGAVSVPSIHMGCNRPIAKCEKCGATVKQENYGPILPMNGSVERDRQVHPYENRKLSGL